MAEVGERDIQEIARNCTRFLHGHKRRTVQERLQAMADSPLSLLRGDNYGRGGFVTDFESEIAELLGKEAAVLMPSGTMAQQIALRIWSDLAGNKRVAFHPTCHLQMYEHMAYRELHGLEGVLLGEADRLFTLEDLSAVESPVSTLLIELPQREIGGQLPSWEELQAVCEAAKARGMRLHMDGARLWECAPFYGRSYAEIAAPFDSVYVSLYKILFGFPGAVLAGPSSFVETARVWLRRHGGNLQEQSVTAISARLAVENVLPRIPEYVAKAGEIAEILRRTGRVRVVPEHPPTNMMHLYFSGEPSRLVDAALMIAEEDKVGLFFGLGDDGKLEFYVADGTMEFSNAEIEWLFGKLFLLAGDGKRS